MTLPLLSLLLLILPACVGNSAPAPAVAPPAPPPAPAPPSTPVPPPAPPAAAVPSSDQLVEMGACREDEGTITEVRTTNISEGRKLLEVTCAQYAYQISFQFWIVKPGAPAAPALLSPEGSPLTGVGFPSFDPSTSSLEWLSKSRGPGDCGDFYVYTLQGETFSLREHRSRACSDEPTEEEIPPPQEWPLVP